MLEIKVDITAIYFNLSYMMDYERNFVAYISEK